MFTAVHRIYHYCRGGEEKLLPLLLRNSGKVCAQASSLPVPPEHFKVLKTRFVSLPMFKHYESTFRSSVMQKTSESKVEICGGFPLSKHIVS